MPEKFGGLSPHYKRARDESIKEEDLLKSANLFNNVVGPVGSDIDPRYRPSFKPSVGDSQTFTDSAAPIQPMQNQSFGSSGAPSKEDFIKSLWDDFHAKRGAYSKPSAPMAPEAAPQPSAAPMREQSQDGSRMLPDTLEKAQQASLGAYQAQPNTEELPPEEEPVDDYKVMRDQAVNNFRGGMDDFAGSSISPEDLEGASEHARNLALISAFSKGASGVGNYRGEGSKAQFPEYAKESAAVDQQDLGNRFKLRDDTRSDLATSASVLGQVEQMPVNQAKAEQARIDINTQKQLMDDKSPEAMHIRSIAEKVLGRSIPPDVSTNAIVKSMPWIIDIYKSEQNAQALQSRLGAESEKTAGALANQLALKDKDIAGKKDVEQFKAGLSKEKPKGATQSFNDQYDPETRRQMQTYSDQIIKRGTAADDLNIIASQIEDLMKQGKTQEAVAVAKQSLKNINSGTVGGQDAIQKEEAERLGASLNQVRNPLEYGSDFVGQKPEMFARDVRNLANRINEQIGRAKSSYKGLAGRDYGGDQGRAAPTQAPQKQQAPASNGLNSIQQEMQRRGLK